MWCTRAHSSSAVPGYASASRRRDLSAPGAGAVDGRALEACRGSGACWARSDRSYGASSRHQEHSPSSRNETVCSQSAQRRGQAPDGRGRHRRHLGLLEAACAADGHRALGEHKWLDLVQGGREGLPASSPREPGTSVSSPMRRSAGATTTSWAVEYVVHPAWRQLRARLQTEISCVQPSARSPPRAGATCTCGSRSPARPTTPSPRPSACGAAATVPDAAPAARSTTRASAIATRPFRPGVDEEHGSPSTTGRFAAIPSRALDLATITERERQDWFDPSGFFLHDVRRDLPAFAGRRSTS